MSSPEEISEDDSAGSDFEPGKKPSKKTGGKTSDNKKAKSEDKISKPNAPKKARESIERVYQKKTQKEHILLRPDTYIGSVEKVTQVLSSYVTLFFSFINRLL